jgi:hypothetical protein
MKQGFVELKVTGDIDIQGIGPCGKLNKSERGTHFEHFSHLDVPYKQ